MKLLKCERFVVLLCGLCITILAACAPFERKEPETAVPKQALPAQLPALSKLELIQAPGGARLAPKGDIVPGAAKLQRAAMDEIREDSPIVQAVERHLQVQEKLGRRYFFINAEPVKAKDRFCPMTMSQAPVQATPASAMTRGTTIVTAKPLQLWLV